ncbi:MULTISPECIES: DUF2934 domain-containing protein [Methylocaldum]|jgi:hypothetical protein|uniref:DUF2934 domain-containing protein n=1 Tax=unclassified Methylocaldum TaxID=2622260 RepID=UPI00098AAE03|nr:hypothetical protein [Methylocaldum sp. RMAD-M]MVF24697.1 DUF2934 domain-containing protein [Methylocaldum sp. BRCS4]
MARKALKAVDDMSEDLMSDAPSNPVPFPDDEINQKIAEAAYYRAEKRGFVPGYEVEDWLEAEKEIRAGSL